MPDGSEQSIEAVAAYVKSAEPDPMLRIKALHDYVADRVAYDAVAYATRTFPPQTAQAVFASKKAVCAGYAKLFAALGKAMGEDVVYVVGQARTQGMRNDGESHAWNAVRIDGRYHLVDVTWDSGSVDGTTFKKGFRSDYFLTPPEAFGVDHFPDDARWQLRDPPMTRGDFMRQPMLSPSFYAQGFGLVAPTRSQTTVQGEITIELQNPRGLYTLADFVQLAEAGGGSSRTRCDAGGAQGEDRRATRIRCRFSAPGSYAVRLFSGPEQYGQYDYIGQLEVNSGS
jgi:transglutaminase/protease-like cytokinesis protein 3